MFQHFLNLFFGNVVLGDVLHVAAGIVVQVPADLPEPHRSPHAEPIIAIAIRRAMPHSDRPYALPRSVRPYTHLSRNEARNLHAPPRRAGATRPRCQTGPRQPLSSGCRASRALRIRCPSVTTVGGGILKSTFRITVRMDQPIEKAVRLTVTDQASQTQADREAWRACTPEERLNAVEALRLQAGKFLYEYPTRLRRLLTVT